MRRAGTVILVTRFAGMPDRPPRVDPGFALPLEVDCLTSVRIRVAETASELILRDGDPAPDAPGLADGLNAMSADQRREGVRIRCGPRVSTERLLRVLQVFAQQESDLRVVLDIREGEPPATTPGLDLDGKPVRLVPLEGELKAELHLRLWR